MGTPQTISEEAWSSYMMPVLGKPILEYQINLLKEHEFKWISTKCQLADPLTKEGGPTKFNELWKKRKTSGVAQTGAADGGIV